MLNIGCHLSASKGYTHMAKEAISIGGNTFQFFRGDFKIEDKPVPTVSGQWNSNVYKINKMILIDAYHPSRKGGEDSGYDYVTSIVKAYRKAIENNA